LQHDFQDPTTVAVNAFSTVNRHSRSLGVTVFLVGDLTMDVTMPATALPRVTADLRADSGAPADRRIPPPDGAAAPDRDRPSGDRLTTDAVERVLKPYGVTMLPARTDEPSTAPDRGPTDADALSRADAASLTMARADPDAANPRFPA
jgi:hypothetical protein